MRLLFIVLALILACGAIAQAMDQDTTGSNYTAPASSSSTSMVATPTGSTVYAASPSSSYGMVPYQVYDRDGRVLLSYDQATDLYRAGYDWLDVAVATNVTRYSGSSIQQVLSNLKSNGTWQQTLFHYRVAAKDAYNVADYPFPRKSIYSGGLNSSTTAAIAKYQIAGTWPNRATSYPGGVGAGTMMTPSYPNTAGCGSACPNPSSSTPCNTTK